MIGANAGDSNISGYYNTFMGSFSGGDNIEGDYNTYIGSYAGAATTGSRNTFLGHFSGAHDTTGSGNVFLGYKAGMNETGSNKLYVANDEDTSDVLIYGEFNNGRIGLGTLAPTERLDVAGTVRMDGFKLPTGATDGYVLISDASGMGSWQPAAGSDSVMYADSSGYAEAAGTDGDWLILGNDMYTTVSGNVGIGTTSPVRKLHVAGDLKVESTAWLDDVSMDAALMNSASIVSAVMANAQIDHLTASDATLDSVSINEASVMDKMGIGTTSPARKLHVMDVIRLEPTTAPSSPSEGDIYMDSTTHKLMVYDGTTWQECW